MAAGIVTTDVKLDGTPDAVLDFNGDGKADVVTWQSNGNHAFSVLLGKGDGTFNLAPGSPLALDFNPIDAVVGDFDGDGKLDLALLGLTSSDPELEMWLGDGTGGFTRAASSPIDLGSISSAEFAMAAGDFNKDGKLDLAIANARNLPISVQILTGDGSGGFSLATPILVDGADSVAVADFNKDGNLDLAVTGDGAMDVLLGDGAGNFAKTSASPYSVPLVAGGVPVSVHRLQLGDFNNDGTADLVVGGENLNINAAAVQVLLGNGQGGFTVQPSTPVPQVAQGIDDVIVGDFNGDGKQDLVAVSPGAPNAEVLLGNGTGTFTDGSSVRSAGDVGTGDFNGDGLPDLALVADDANVYMVPNISTPAQVVTTTLLVFSQNPSVLGQPVKFTATVTASDSSTPTGNVTITIDNDAPQSVPLANGQVAFTPPTLALGSHTVVVEYAAQGHFAASAGGLFQVVRRAANFTWSGAGLDNHWSDGANWVGGVAPVPGDHLVFPADAAQQTNVNDYTAGSFFASLLFTAGQTATAGGQYAISGNAITVGAGGITDKADHSSNTIAVPITLAGPAGYITLQNSADTLTLAGPVSDGPAAPAAGLVKSGAGDLVISSGSTLYTGTTLVTRGEVDVENNFALGTGAAVVRAGATLRLVLPFANALLGLSNPLILAGTLATGSLGSRPVYWFGSITLSGMAPSIAPGGSSDSSSTLIVNGTITGRSGLAMQGAGTLVLAGNNVYTGPTTVRAGVVEVTNPAGLGSSVLGASVSSGAMLALSGGISVATDVALADRARLGSLDGDNTLSGMVTLSGGKAGTIEVDGDQLTIIGVVKEFSARMLPAMLLKIGIGTLVLPRANTFTGGAQVVDGIIDLQDPGGLGSGGIQVDDGGTLALDLVARQRGQAFIFKQRLNLSGTGLENQGALELLRGTVTWAGALQLDDAACIATTGSNVLTVSGTISGDTLMTAGTGDVQLLGSNTYTGAIFVLGGDLDLLNAQALSPTGEGVTVAAGATLRLLTSSGAFITQPLTLLDQSQLVATGTIDWENTVTYAGTAQVSVAAQAQLELGGPLTGTNGARLEEGGGGALILASTLHGETPFATVLGPDGFTPNQIQVDAGVLDLTSPIPRLFGASLQVSLAAGFTPAIGQAFTIIHDTSANPIRGFFIGLGEGRTFTVGGFSFQITYKGGAGNDVVLTRVA
jgi:autotransporter-associated beta strand protein